MIRFVYFDLGNVLWAFDEVRACQNMATLLEVEEARARRAMYESGLQTRFEQGRVTPSGYVEEICRELRIPESQVDFQKVLDAASDMFMPVEPMAEIMVSVKDTGTPIGILSNTCHAHWDWIERQQHDLMKVPFDAIVLSYEVSSMKPDDQIYRAAELLASVAADQILFVDDKLENVQAAQSRGWKAVRTLSSDDVQQALIDHGVI